MCREVLKGGGGRGERGFMGKVNMSSNVVRSEGLG